MEEEAKVPAPDSGSTSIPVNVSSSSTPSSTEPAAPPPTRKPMPSPDTEPMPTLPTAGTTIKPGQNFTPPPKQGGKRGLIIFAILIIIAAIALGAWYMMGKKKAATPTTSSNQTQTTPMQNYEPVNVAYAFKDATSPFNLYTRPASGGDRVSSTPTLATSETITGSDVNGSNVVFATTKAIYVSTDGGKTYKSIVTLKPNEQITSIKFATDGKSIAYGDYSSDVSGKNNVTSIDLSGGNSKTLFTANSAGVLITGYSSTKQQIIYSLTCVNCDGTIPEYNLKDLKTNKNTVIVAKSSSKVVVSAAASNDFTTFVYATGVPATGEPLMGTYVAPYTISQIDLATNKSTDLTSFGTSGEKNSNGTIKSRQVLVGFVAGTNGVYYTNDNELFEIKNGKPSLTYQASKPILFLPFVGDKNIISGAGDQTADYALTNFEISSQKSVKIFSGDNNTVILGVTTK